ncbi:uncharacterized protein LOC107037967 [Diachasma alloeum]|uniref:uncharacterized protein LOC107037967 n=1 Tax=Diachasma alloeum TaxID=454923 RepID=UPI0007383712|nr:uncharacterized protein LOC107037967 [Diachasma alloeum]
MSETHLQDLQSILRSQLGDNTIVESYITKDLLPPGENYGSKLVSVHAVIKRSKNEKPEDLYLVAKLPPLTEFQRDMFDSPFTFRKEIFMYAEILPFYRKLEINSGVIEQEALDISPKYYGSRLSMNPDIDFDDDAAILLENLKAKGFYCTERRLGCDLAHAKLAVRAIARFHALGMATKEKDPDFFETLKARSKCLEMKNPDQWEKFLGQRIKNIEDDPEIAKYLESCVKTVRATDQSAWTTPPDEPWSTIIHSDFWANNILFHKSAAGEPDDVKFIDYQNYLFLSPARELAFFIGSGLNHETAGSIDELLDLYYDTLIERLKILDCDVEPYSRESFDEVLKVDSRVEFTHCLFMVKILTMDVNADDPDVHDVKDLLERGDCGEAYRSRLRDFVNSFHERGWLLQ